MYRKDGIIQTLKGETIMNNNDLYITITHINAYGGPAIFRIGDILTLKKEHENLYDDEAILAYGRHNAKCGYVANSVTTVARGTYSAGRLYDRFDETIRCKVMFVLDDEVIARIIK